MFNYSVKKKDINLLLENGLVYIGYVVGIILLLENIANIINNGSQVGVRIFLFTAFLWFISLISRKLVFGKRYGSKIFEKMKIEIVYFLFCHTFTTLFVSTILKYTPVTLFSAYETKQFVTSSPLMTNVTTNLAFVFVINAFFVVSLMFALLMLTEVIYKSMASTSGRYVGGSTRAATSKILSFGVMIVLTLGILQIPFISGAYDSLTLKLNLFLKDNFQWLFDYLIGSPLVYYVYASFRGSKLAEEFSLYRKFL